MPQCKIAAQPPLYMRMSDVCRLFCGLVELEDDALHAIAVAAAGDVEAADFGGAAHVGSGAKTAVVVADANDSDGVGGSFGKAAHVEALHGFSLSEVRLGHFDIGTYDRVDVVLERLDLLGSQGAGHVIVEFRLLALHMGAESAAAAKAPGHLAVDDMLGRVHRGIFLFVVVVENVIFHDVRVK